DAPEVKVEVSSGSSAELKGFTRKLIGRAGSGSTLDAEDLKSEEADLSASSGSTIRGFASVALQAEASSGGSVRYSGPAELKVSKSESSGGSVQAHE
ncbi:MAG TPA: DUF2807 domain-containing protein, partial [Cyclobacteriaceae bacterium]|nr:DUF2807 domain-containing protein [Cyclobacteriaceae bacterium]